MIYNFLQEASPMPFFVFLLDEEKRSNNVGNKYSGIPPELYSMLISCQLLSFLFEEILMMSSLSDLL